MAQGPQGSPRAREVPSEVVSRAASGDRGAQQALLEANCGFIRRMLYKLVGPADDLDDLQQNVMLRILKSLPKFRRESALSTWIGGICVNVAKDHFRRKKVRSAVIPVGGPGDLPPFGAADTENRVEARERLGRCMKALDELSPNHLTAFVLRVAYGYSIEEIAKMTGSFRSTARLRLYYARKAFAKAYAAGRLARGAPPSGDREAG